MTIEEFHRILLCIVYGSSEIFNHEFIKYDINCLNCPYKQICDEIINIYFQNKSKSFSQFPCNKE